MSDPYLNAAHVLKYLARADSLPHRTEGERCLLEELPARTERILDLGAGAGRLFELALAVFPDAQVTAVDFSPTMLEKLREKWGNDPRVRIVEHDLSRALPALGEFDAAISSFAIHHLEHERKRELYAEVWPLLRAGGVFCNLEHVASPTPSLHEAFYRAMNVPIEEEDSSNKLLDVETQLRWLREIGFHDVDCLWKWREMALLAGRKPAVTPA